MNPGEINGSKSRNKLVFFYLLIQGMCNGIISFQFHDILVDSVPLSIILLIEICLNMGFALNPKLNVRVSSNIYHYSI